jgi:hypothetical protein
MSLDVRYGEENIDQFTSMLRNGQLNLEPGFQRKSVWGVTDRRRLIQSITSGFPLPSIFLYKRHHNGKLIYDVIDGKQRLESIFMFKGIGRFRKSRFEVKLDLGDGLDWFNWKDISRRHSDVQAAFDAFQMQTVQVSGDLNEIIDLFVRINSTGKRLTSGEKRHARFYTSPFLKAAERLVTRYHHRLLEDKILSSAQIDRMKGTELFAELLMSIHKGGPVNKKTALDRAIGNDSINLNTLGRLAREFVRTMNLVHKMFPDLRQTRFRNSAEFYTLFMLVWEMDHDKFVLKDRRRNKVAFQLLKKLSNGVDELREQLRRVKPAKPAQRIYSEYLLTVQGDTDSSATRERRRQILTKLLGSIYDRKDANRLFTPEQRRIIWNTEEKKVCIKCRRQLRWDDFTVDHIIAHARGGKTRLKNAQLLCRSCNSRKGAR